MRARAKFGESGFSVVELLVAVTVIMIIVSIALPRMLQARIKAKEAAAISTMKAVQNAQTLYASTFPDVGYASQLSYLAGSGFCDTISSSNACMIDTELGSGSKGGYNFVMNGDGSIPDLAYSLQVSPQSGPASGQCSFSTDESGVIQGHSINDQPISRLSMGAVGAAGCGGL